MVVRVESNKQNFGFVSYYCHCFHHELTRFIYSVVVGELCVFKIGIHIRFADAVAS